MCVFCDALINKDKEITWNVRSTYADDNINEVLNSHGEEFCGFKLNGYKHNDDVYVGVEFKQEIIMGDGRENAVIWSFSESIQFNYCPVCGSQISNQVKPFEEYYEHKISIGDI